MEDVPIICINFGSVFCGKKVKKSFTIENISEETRNYSIVSTKGFSPCDGRLQIKPLQAIGLPKQSLIFNLTYVSYLENLTENFWYSICDCNTVVSYLKIHARSVGPSLKVPSYNIKFFRTHNKSQTAKQIIILNTEKCNAKYCFDLDENNSFVRISKPSGIISAGSKLNVTFNFEPIESGIYYKQIYCIVQFHKPIVFNITGIYKPKLKVEPKNITFKYTTQFHYNNNYEAYMSKLATGKIEEDLPFSEELPREFDFCVDTSKTSKNPEETNEEKEFKDCPTNLPVFSNYSQSIEDPKEIVLTRYFIDIKNLAVSHQATTLINLSKTRTFFYQWDDERLGFLITDLKNHFQIEPCHGVVEPKEKVDFSIYFTPSTPDLLYHKEADIRVFPYGSEKNLHDITLPLTMSLKIIGHSFRQDNSGWIPQCIPEPKSLQLPSCVPGETVYGTVAIERRGHLPATFVTISPNKSNYIIQPPLGYISENIQLLLIQFDGKSKEKGIYKEDLKIVYNNDESNFDILKLTTVVEIPEIIFGTENKYTFGNTFPGSKSVEEVPIENKTALYLYYEIIIPDEIDWIAVPEPRGSIEPMSFGNVTFVFKPEVSCEYSGCVECSAASASMIEYSKITNIHFQGSCQFGYLVATPSVFDFGESAYAVEKTKKVHVFNFSPVQIYFRLYVTCDSSDELISADKEDEIKITPCRGSALGKGSFEIEVAIIPFTTYAHYYVVKCQILQSHIDEEPCREDPTVLFSFTIKGVLPGMQVVDLNVDGGGPLFSPHWLWKMMSINRLNELLNSLTPEGEIDITLPEVMLKSRSINLALLLEANRYGETYMNIEKKIMCTCCDEAEKSALSEKCMHENSINMAPAELKLGPKKTAILQITLKYAEIRKCQLVLNIYLPYNRKITMSCIFIALPNDEPSFISRYLNSEFKLKPVFIGDPDPPLQLYWLYNNTSWPTSYEVDETALGETPVHAHKAFDCKNPKGVIPAFSCIPLMFQFRPNELLTYMVNIFLRSKENMFTSISLRGEGILSNSQFDELKLEKTLPEKPVLFNLNIAIESSIHVINISFFRTFSETQRLFFLKNRSTTEMWAFQWHNFRIKDLIHAHVEPLKGVMKPEESVAMTLIVKTFGYPSCVTFSVPCDVINYSKLFKYEEALVYSKTVAQKSEEYFTITEKGISYDFPGVTLPEKPEPNHIFITVNANIISTHNIDQKLTLNQQLILKAGKELKPQNVLTSVPNSVLLKSIQTYLEKVIWNILNSKIFENKIYNLQKYPQFLYTQLIPEGKRDKKHTDRSLLIPRKHFVQTFVEDIIRNILIKNHSSRNLNSEQNY